MIELVAAVICFVAGAGAGWAMIWWNPHPLVSVLIVIVSAALVFWAAGSLGKMLAMHSLETFWQGLTGEVSTPTEAAAVAPVVLPLGFMAMIGAALSVLVWAISGVFLWLLGMLAGGVLSVRRAPK